MNDVLAWLKTQHHGLRTFRALNERLEALADHDSDNRALYRVVSAPIERFLVAFDDEIMSSETAERAYRDVIAVLEKAATALNASPAQKVEIMNSLAAAELF
jgi:hypothetical protein